MATPYTLGILGGTGFVGRHLIARLRADGHALRVLTRKARRHRALAQRHGIELVQADVHDGEALTRALEGCDGVINLVGILNEKGHDGRGFSRVHVDLPRKIVDACRSNGSRRLLHMSALGADAAYGHSHYQRTKGEGENLVHTALDLHVTSFRPSVIYGPDDAFINRFARLLRLTPALFPLACPNARFAPIHVDDVAEAFARSLDDKNTYRKRLELCGPDVYTLQALVEQIAAAYGLRRRIAGLNNFFSRAQAELLERIPGKPFSRDNFLSMQRDNVCSGPFPPELGFAPRAFRSALAEMVQAKQSDH